VFVAGSRYCFEAFDISGQGVFQVSNMIPPQRQHGAGQGTRSWLVVVSPHVKQIHALLRM